MKKKVRNIALALAAMMLCSILAGCAPAAEEKKSSTYLMSTLVTQTAYGEGAEEAMAEVEEALGAFEQRLSLFGEEGDIARLNAAAGGDWVDIDPATTELLQKSQALSAGSEGAFAVTIAPLTLAWGVTGAAPRVPSDEEIEALLPLVDDEKLDVREGSARLLQPGMAVDLGGIAKGEACAVAEKIYATHHVDSALLSIGGNIYAKGEKPNGRPWQVGFRDPGSEADGSIATFPLRDEVISVSGGYERYFEEDGERYIHIFDPRTGWPAQSDIVSVGIIDPDGAVADFYSTTLFVLGREKALEYMKAGGRAIVLDDAGVLYVSRSLEDGFALHEENEQSYDLVYVEEEGA